MRILLGLSLLRPCEDRERVECKASKQADSLERAFVFNSSIPLLPNKISTGAVCKKDDVVTQRRRAPCLFSSRKIHTHDSEYDSKRKTPRLGEISAKRGMVLHTV